METGVAQAPIDIDEYREQLERRLGKAHEVMRVMIHKAQRQPKRVVFPEGEEPKILRACQILMDEKIARPILLGDEARIRAAMEELHLHLDGLRIVDPAKSGRLPAYAEEMYSLRQRKGVTRREAGELILDAQRFRRHDGASGRCRCHGRRAHPALSRHDPARPCKSSRCAMACAASPAFT